MTPRALLDRISPHLPQVALTRGAALLAVALLQLVILGTMLGERLYLLKSGREIVLKTQPVDPHDFFKGDFAQLTYDISSVPLEVAAGIGAKAGTLSAFTAGTAAFVTLAQAPDGAWQVVKLSADFPATVASTEVVLKAWPRHGAASSSWPLNVRYGIEHYFVPEGTGHDLEKLASQHRLEVIVAVGRQGDAAIKGLAIDGKHIYDEPIY